MKQNKILDLTTNEWKTNSNWKYVGLTIVNRPYKRKILALAIGLCSLSLLLPDLGLGIYSGIKLVNKYG